MHWISVPLLLVRRFCLFFSKQRLLAGFVNPITNFLLELKNRRTKPVAAKPRVVAGSKVKAAVEIKAALTLAIKNYGAEHLETLRLTQVRGRYI